MGMLRYAVIASLLCAAPVHARTQDPAIARFETGLGPTVQEVGSPPQRWTVEERMAFWNIPGVSIVVIRGGRIAWAKGYGTRRAGRNEPVDADTLFSVGSLSKIGAAMMAMELGSAGRLDIDADVNTYLKRWTVPCSPYTSVRPITMRGLLSHTAGLTVNGFDDYAPGETLPTLLQTLDGAGPAKNDPVRAFYTPGSASSYSGGGTEVARLVMEDLTGVPFEQLASDLLFRPLGMTASTYVNPLPEAFSGRVAKAHDAKGAARALRRGWEAMPEIAASGLWTTPSDYARLMIALYDAARGKPGALIDPRHARAMLTEVAGSRTGAGPFLRGEGARRQFYHSGSNDSYRAWMEMNLATGDGLVLFTNSPGGSKFRYEVARAIAKAENWATGDYLETPPVRFGEGELQRIAGDYVVSTANTTLSQRLQTTNQPLRFRISADDRGLLLVSAADSEPMRLIPLDPTHFVFERTSGRRIEIIDGYDGQPSGLIYREDGLALEASRVGGDGSR